MKTVEKNKEFRVRIQEVIQREAGVRVSQTVAHKIFRGIIGAAVDLTFEFDSSIPIAGIGTFEILKTKPRSERSKGDPETGEGAWPFVPRFRFYPSVAINRLLEVKYGFTPAGDVAEDVEQTGEDI